MKSASPIRMCPRRERGLTLVELIVTVAILSILATAAVAGGAIRGEAA